MGSTYASRRTSPSRALATTGSGVRYARVIFLVLVIALATGMPRALFMMQNRSTPGSAAEQITGLQYIRDFFVIILTVFLVQQMSRRKQTLLGRTTASPGVAFVVVVVAGLLARSWVIGVSFEITAFGMRALLYPVIYMGLRWMTRDDADDLLINVARLSKPLVLVEGVFALYQTQTAAGIFGATFIGARPWGSLATPNSLAATMITFALLFAIARPKRWGWWLTITLAIAFLSGSRAGTVGAVIILGALLIHKIRYRALIYPFAGAVTLLSIYAFSSEAVSGRAISNEGRFSQWTGIFDLMSHSEKIAGMGVGIGSNASISLHGSDALGGTVADSQVVASYLSFGILGLVLVVWGTAAIWKNSGSRNQLLLVPSVVLLGLVYNITEVSPANILLAVVAGASAFRAFTEGTQDDDDKFKRLVDHRGRRKSSTRPIPRKLLDRLVD